MANNSASFLGGMLLGTALGAAAGLLAAPRPGRETRHLLRKSADALPELADDLSSTLQLQADRLSETTLKNWDHTLNRLRDAIAAGQAASRSTYNNLTQGERPLSPDSPPQN